MRQVYRWSPSPWRDRIAIVSAGYEPFARQATAFHAGIPAVDPADGRRKAAGAQ